MLSECVRFRSGLLLILVAVCGLLLAAGGARAGEEKTKRVYLMGSSLTDQVKYEKLAALAASRGYEHVWGRHMVPGAPIRWLWSHREAGNYRNPFGPCGKALAEYEWDAVTLEPRDGYESELAAANELIDYTVEKSPHVQFYVFAQWPRIGRGSFDKQWLSPVKDIQNNIRLGFEEFLTDLREAHPDIKPPLMIPVGHAFHLLQLEIKAGLVPGMSSIFDGYSDRSHQNPLGEYIVGCTFFATIYAETPVGLPTQPYGEIDPALARAIQETVWEAVNAHPRSGVKASGEFRIVTPYLPDAIEGSLYDRELLSAFGKTPVEYSLADGSLPPGIEVAPEGRITGRASRTGDHRFTVQAVDARGAAATRELSLNCAGESKPAIPDQELPPMSRGRYISYPFKAEGGNGEISWRLERCRKESTTDGQQEWQALKRAGRALMPQGLELSPDGTMSGSPGVAGSYRLLIVAEDSDPTEPDSAQREFVFEVGLAAEDVYLAPEVGRGGVRIDGKPDEDFWELNQPIAKAVSGRPSAKASFGLYWNPSDLYIAIEVEDDQIVADSEEPWNDDGVEVFLDILNDRQTEYNSDDKRLVVAVSGNKHLVGLEDENFQTSVQRTEDGYIVEVHIRMNSLGSRNRDNTAYGFDVAVNDDDDGGSRDGQLVWRGTESNDADPSGFATILLAPAEE